MSHDKSYKSKNIPSQYTSATMLNETIEKYLDNCKIFKNLPNMPGLSLYLGFNSYDELLLWLDKNKRFRSCLSRANTILEERGIQLLCQPDLKNGNGVKAYMSKNFRYTEKIDVNNTGSVKIIRLPAKGKPNQSVKDLLASQKKTMQRGKKSVSK